MDRTHSLLSIRTLALSRDFRYAATVIHLGVTGPRHPAIGAQLKQFALYLFHLIETTPDDVITLHHGDCIGVDAQAHCLALALRFRTVIHPPINDKYRAFCPNPDEIRQEKPYLDRNRDIVNESLLLIGLPRQFTEQTRSGTWATLRYASNRIPRIIIYPDGSLEHTPEPHAPDTE